MRFLLLNGLLEATRSVNRVAVAFPTTFYSSILLRRPLPPIMRNIRINKIAPTNAVRIDSQVIPDIVSPISKK